MDTAAIGVAEEEDEEQGIDQQDIFYRVVFFLAAITLEFISINPGPPRGKTTSA
jgi:hypothetical protein